MTDTALNGYVMQGTSTQRVAHTPVPATPASGAALGIFWYETDTGLLYSWTASAWAKVASGGLSTFDPGSGAIVKPVTANLTVVGAGMTVANLASGRGVSFTMAAGGGIQDITLNGYTPPASGAGDFSVTALVAFHSGLSGAWSYGVSLTDSAGVRLSSGFRNAPSFCQTNFTTSGGVISFSGINAYETCANYNGPVWCRMARVGTNILHQSSQDGETWFTWRTESATAFLGTTLASMGFMFFGNGTTQQVGTLYSLSHSP